MIKACATCGFAIHRPSLPVEVDERCHRCADDSTDDEMCGRCNGGEACEGGRGDKPCRCLLCHEVEPLALADDAIEAADRLVAVAKDAVVRATAERERAIADRARFAVPRATAEPWRCASCEAPGRPRLADPYGGQDVCPMCWQPPPTDDR